jgi:hypothetical protein
MCFTSLVVDGYFKFVRKNVHAHCASHGCVELTYIHVSTTCTHACVHACVRVCVNTTQVYARLTDDRILWHKSPDEDSTGGVLLLGRFVTSHHIAPQSAIERYRQCTPSSLTHLYDETLCNLKSVKWHATYHRCWDLHTDITHTAHVSYTPHILASLRAHNT